MAVGLNKLYTLPSGHTATCVDREDEPKRDLHLVVRVDDDDR